MRVIGLPCPHCEYTVRAVKSRTMSAMFKEITYMCQNPDCGHSFVAGLEVLRTLSLPELVPTSPPGARNNMKRGACKAGNSVKRFKEKLDF
ncbi:ogr/Delta-like zinc finger family protein [Janthinobacterium lividum]|uniref:ogr/Delta-like zinc finger family protein n=1 Tax=Janthinobacterium lividum TaxID=29581 RepID=UPI0009B85598|nr:ogr/Delta-like zinc finger family protein [Janthinobacterium lividum]